MVGSKYACRPHLAVPLKCLDMLLTNFHFFSFLQQILFTTKFFLFSEEVPYQAKSLGYYTKYLLKKIVALALCLVLALSLCATAFAAGFSGATLKDATDAAKDGKVTTTITKIQDARSDATNSYAPLYLLTVTIKDSAGTVTGTTTKNAVEMADANGADIYYVEGSAVRYFKDVTAAPAATVKVTAATVVTKKSEVKCGVILANEDDDVYVTSSGDYYLGGGSTQAIVGDKYVMVDTVTATPTTVSAVNDSTFIMPAAGTVYEVKHAYKADTTTVNGETTVAKVYCDDAKCKINFKFVVGSETKAIKELGVGNYVDTQLSVAGVTSTTTKIYVAKTGAGTTGTTSGSKVDSAKTFDAGIALYVGMSISAVAGSAVVIGKKKEF